MRSRRLWAAPRHHRHARHWLRRAGGWPRQRGRSAGMSDMGSWLLFCNASRTFWKLFDSCCPPPLPPTFSARKGWTVKPTHSCVQGDDNPNGGVALGGPLRSEHTVSLGARSAPADRKSTRLNSSHLVISYAVFCLKKKKEATAQDTRVYAPVQ